MGCRTVGAGDDGVTAGLMFDDDVCAPAWSATISPPRGTCAMCETRLPMVPLATKRPAGLARQLSGALLESDDGGVVSEDVVADLGSRPWRGASRGRLGDGV